MAKSIDFTFTPARYQTNSKGLFPYQWFNDKNKLTVVDFPKI